MRKERLQSDSAETASTNSADESSASPLSLSRLREAFAAMLSGSQERVANSEVRTHTTYPSSAKPAEAAEETAHPGSDPCEINPRSVVEAILFVGRPDNGAFSARELAVAMRGCSPAEIDDAVADLNALYSRDAAPYAIVGSSKGYRLALRDEFRRVRDKFHGRVRDAKLSRVALEVLAIVAYNQPTTAADITSLRGGASGAALATLVRLQLVCIDRPASGAEAVRYSTTNRFLRLFGLENVSALPRSEELEKA